MNWKKLLTIGIALTATSSLWSNVCDPCDFCDGWSVHADWLYWTNIPGWIRFVSCNSASAHTEQFGSLGFDGLFVRLNAAF